MITFQCDMCGATHLTTRLDSRSDEFGHVLRLKGGWELVAACLPADWQAVGSYIVCDNIDCLLKLKRHEQYKPARRVQYELSHPLTGDL